MASLRNIPSYFQTVLSSLVVHKPLIYITRQANLSDQMELQTRKKRKVTFLSKFCLQNHYQKQHASYKKMEVSSVKLPVPQLTTRLQYWKELFSLHRSMPHKNSVAWKGEKEADLQRDLWQTPEEKAVDEINDKLQTQKHWSLEHWHLICKFSLCSGILPPFDVYRQVLTGDAGWGESPFPIISSNFF